MTIIDVMLHKWRMLDDKRRKIILASILLAIVFLVILILALRPTSDGHKPAPTPTPAPTPAPTLAPTTQPPPTPPPTVPPTTPPPTETPQPTTTLAPTTPSPTLPPLVPVNIASEDGKAVASLTGSVKIGEQDDFPIGQLTGLEFIQVDQKEGPKRFNLILKAMKGWLKIEAKFFKDEHVVEADELNLTWHQATSGIEKECRLAKPAKGNFFSANIDKHYRCTKPMTFSCEGQESSNVTLIINQIEIEIDRTKPAERSSPSFETDSQECLA